MAFRADCEIWAALRILPTRQQRIIYRRYWGGFEEAEIAVQMNVCVRTVKGCVSDAKNKIEKYLSNVALLGPLETISLMKGKSGKVDRGNRQRPDNQNKTLGSFDRTAPSQNPSPDIYFESPERDDFMFELAACCGMAVSQVVSGYEDSFDAARAMASRFRIKYLQDDEMRVRARRAA